MTEDANCYEDTPPVVVPDPTPEPEPTPECVPGEDSVAVDWEEVPAFFDGKDVDSMRFVNADGTYFTLTPLMPVNPGDRLISVTFADGSTWTACEPLPEPAPEPEPSPLPECVPGEDSVAVDWDEVPAFFNGKDVDSMRFVNADGTYFTLTPVLPLNPGDRLISVTFADGTTWTACDDAVEPTPEPGVIEGFSADIVCYEDGFNYADWEYVPELFDGQEVDLINVTDGDETFNLFPGMEMPYFASINFITGGAEGQVIWNGCETPAPIEGFSADIVCYEDGFNYADWAVVPELFDGQEVDVVNVTVDDETFNLFPGMEMPYMASINFITGGAEGQVIWAGCETPAPIEGFVADILCDADRVATTDWPVVPDLFEGKEVVVVNVTVDGHDYNMLPGMEMIEGATLNFIAGQEGTMLWAGCGVAEPTEVPSVQAPSTEGNKTLPKTGADITVLGLVAGLFAVIGAAGVAVNRMRG